MRNALITLFFLFALVFAAPDFVADFIQPTLEESAGRNNETIAEGGLELLKRQGTGCFQGYSACSGIGAPGLCCRTNQVCSADAAGHVACCPRGAACTGTIAGVSGGTQTQATVSVPASATSTVPFVGATTTPNGPSIGTATTTDFVQQTGTASYVRSTPPVLPLIRVVSRMLRAVRLL